MENAGCRHLDKSLENVWPKSGEDSDLCFSIFLPYFTSDLLQINKLFKDIQLNISKLRLALQNLRDPMTGLGEDCASWFPVSSP